MEEQENLVESLFEKAQEYSKTTVELYKLKALDKTADVVSTMASSLVVTGAVLFFLFLFNIAVALWIGDLLGKSYYGFFIVAGFYCLASIVLNYMMKDWIKSRISNSVITHMFKK